MGMRKFLALLLMALIPFGAAAQNPLVDYYVTHEAFDGSVEDLFSGYVDEEVAKKWERSIRDLCLRMAQDEVNSAFISDSRLSEETKSYWHRLPQACREEDIKNLLSVLFPALEGVRYDFAQLKHKEGKCLNVMIIAMVGRDLKLFNQIKENCSKKQVDEYCNGKMTTDQCIFIYSAIN